MNDIVKTQQQKKLHPQPQSPVVQQQRTSRVKANKKMKLLCSIGVVLLLIIFASSLYYFKFADIGVQKSRYQAVFLTDGQVYFGKLSNIKADYVSVTDVYYLQSNTQTDVTKESGEGRPQPQLIKLGSEIHGPEDAIKIKAEQVSYWENLKTDSKVTKAIEEYKQNQ